MTAQVQDLELKYADKIAKLLSKAEDPGATEAEAQAFMQKAAQLMREYAIDEAMVAAARGLTFDELVQDEFMYTGIYRNGYQQLGAAVAKYFDLKVVYGRDTYAKPIKLPLFLAGFRSDVERARLLDTSLQLQCVTAHTQWWRANKDRCSWMDKGMTFRTRRDFVFGFADGVDSKLREASRAAKVEAKKHEAERSGDTAETASASVELVLVGRKEKVNEFYDTVWGGRTRSVRHNYGVGGAGGRSAGHEAGRNANTNTGPGIGGARGALGR